MMVQLRDTFDIEIFLIKNVRLAETQEMVPLKVRVILVGSVSRMETALVGVDCLWQLC